LVRHSQHRQVGAGVTANQGGCGRPAVGQAQADVVVLPDHVMGRHNEAIGGPDDAAGRQPAAAFHPDNTGTDRIDRFRQVRR